MTFKNISTHLDCKQFPLINYLKNMPKTIWKNFRTILKLSLNKTLLAKNHFPTLRLVLSAIYPNGKYIFKEDTRTISMDTIPVSLVLLLNRL